VVASAVNGYLLEAFNGCGINVGLYLMSKQC